jgi:hypothetical protein
MPPGTELSAIKIKLLVPTDNLDKVDPAPTNKSPVE